MIEKVNVVVDAMGGDYAPFETVKGAIEAVSEKENLIVTLVGRESVIREELAKYEYASDRIEVVHAEDVITNDEAPVLAIRRKKESSIVVGLNLLKAQKADAFVSAGSTGAVLVGAQLIAGRIKGVERPPLAPLLPTKFISLQFFKSGYVSFTSIFPFSSSAPIFTIATRGFSMPITFSIYKEPIFANCNK